MAIAQWEVEQLEYERQLSSWFAPVTPDQVAQMLFEARAPMCGNAPGNLEIAARTISELKYMRQVMLTPQMKAFQSRTRRLQDAVGLVRAEFGCRAINPEAILRLRERASKQDLNPQTPGTAEIETLWAVYRLLTGRKTFSKRGPATQFIVLAIKEAGWQHRKVNPGSIANDLARIRREKLP